MKKNTKDVSDMCSMNLEEATIYLKKIGEWESAWRFDRDTIIGWANFLKNKQKNDDVSTKPTNKRTAKTTRRVSSSS